MAVSYRVKVLGSYAIGIPDNHYIVALFRGVSYRTRSSAREALKDHGYVYSRVSGKWLRPYWPIDEVYAVIETEVKDG